MSACEVAPLDIAVLRPAEYMPWDCRRPEPPACDYIDIPAWYVWSGVVAAGVVIPDARQAFDKETTFILRGISTVSPGNQICYVRYQATNGRWLSNIREDVAATHTVGEYRRCIHDRRFYPGSFIGIEIENAGGDTIGQVIVFDGVLRYYLKKRRLR